MNWWFKASFYYSIIFCTCHRKNCFFPRVQLALALVLCASCGGELKSICSWVLITTSKPTTRCLVSCFLQQPVGSHVPLLAQVSVLLFKHTPWCALLLQHGLDPEQSVEHCRGHLHSTGPVTGVRRDKLALTLPPQSRWIQPWHLTAFTTHQCCHLWTHPYSGMLMD